MNTSPIISKLKKILIAGALAATTLHATAALVIQENFNYPAGTITSNTVITGTGFTGNWKTGGGSTFTAQANSLSFAGHFPTSGGSLGITISGGGESQLGAAVSQSSLTMLAGSAALYTSSLQTVNIGSYDNNTQLEQRFSSTTTGSASAGRNEVSSYSSGSGSARKLAVSSSTTETKQSTGTMNAGTLYLLVTKYTISGGSITGAAIYAFDLTSYANYLANSTAATADANLAIYCYATLTASGSASLTSSAFNCLQFACYKGVGSGQIDDFRMGTQIFDVVNVPAAPIISGLTNQTIQVGANTALTATVEGNPAPTLQWYLSTDGGVSSNAITGATSSAYSLTNVTYSQSGYIYYILATSTAGTTVSNMTLTVTHTAPTITGLTNQTVYAGNNVNMNGTVGGVPTPALQWYYNGAIISGASTNSYSLTNVIVAQGGVYSLVASNEAGVASNSITLTVVSATVPPTIAGLTNQTVLDGNSAVLSATVGGNPTPALQWYLSTDGGATSNTIAGATNSMYQINSAAYSQNGYIYTLVANNSAGTAAGSMTLTVQQLAPTITGLTNQMIYAGNNATLSAIVSGAPAPTLQWFANGTPITAATNSTLILTNVYGSQNNWTYTLLASNVVGTVTSNAVLAVTNQILCFNFDVNKNIYQNGTAAASDTGTNWNQLLTSGINGSYTLNNVTDSRANTTTCSITVAGSFSSWVDTTTGNPNPVNLIADYYFNGPYTITFSNLPQGNYTLYDYAHGNALNQNSVVTISTANGAVSATTTANAIYTSNFRDTTTGPGVAYVVLNGAVGSSGTFTFTNASYLNGLQLQLISPAGVTALTNQTVIAGNSTVLVPTVLGTSPISYQWSSNGVAIANATNSTLPLNNVQFTQNGTTYSVVASNAAGSDTNDTTLTVIVPPSITGLYNQAAYTGSTVMMIPTVSGVPSPALQWQHNGVNLIDGPTGNGSTISGSTFNTLSITSAQNADSGYYSLIASNSAGVVTNTVTLTVSSTNVAPAITGPVNQTVIQGSNATFTASVSGLPLPMLQWLDQTGTPISGATGSTLMLTNVQYSQNGYTYSLVATNSAGQATNSATLTVLVPVNISNQPQSLVVTNTQSASFSITANGVPTPSYQWYFNGVAIPSANASTYTIASTAPANMGNYVVVVSNSVNAVTSSTATLTVNSTMGYSSPTPANGATGVCYDTPLYIHFTSTPTLRNAGKIQIYNATNISTPVDTIDLSKNLTNDPTYGVNVQAYTIGGMTVTNFPVIINGTTVVIYPHQGLLTSNQTYYVTMDDGTFADSTGAYFAGITNSNAWCFTTKPTGPANGTNIVVAQDYSGDFATVQGAVNFVPSGNTTPTIINIRNGVYTEFVNVNGRNNLDFRGQNRNATLIGYPNNNNLNPGAPQRSAFIINGNDCTLETLTLTNMTPIGGGQAEAVDVEGTRAIFYNIELDSHQDTFLVHYSGKLVYFQDSLVAGDVDFNWGYGTVYYTNCELRSYGANITQPRNPLGQRGFGFMNCRITAANTNVASIGLGRTFGQTNAQALFAHCLMADAVTGFNDAGSTNTADYACSNLTATVNKSLVNSVHLTGSELDAIAVLSATNWLYGWQPQVAANILTNPVSETVTAGQTAIFSASASGISPLSYQWYQNGTIIAGATNSTLIITGASMNNAGIYTVTASTAGGSATSSDATLTVNPLTIHVTATIQGKIYGQTDPALTYSYNPALLNGDSFSGNLSRTSGENVGSYAIGQGTLALNNNYILNYTGANLTISAANLSITANNDTKTYGQTKIYGAGSTAFVSSGLQNGETIGSVTITASGGTTANAPVGSYNLTPSAATGGTFSPANYTITYNNGTLTVAPAGTSVTLRSSLNPAGYLATVSFMAGLPSDATGSVVFSTTNGTFSTNVLANGSATSLSLTNLPRGTNTITVAYVGDGNYLGSTNSLLQVVTNHPPVAANVTEYRLSGQSLTIPLATLLTNVTDVDGDTFTLQSVSNGNQGANITFDSTNVYYAQGTNTNDAFTYTVSDGNGGTATATITVNVYSTGPATATMPVNGSLSIQFYGVPTMNYVVQMTTDLTQPWTTVSTNVAGANGAWIYTDMNATNAQQFYRTRLP